MNVVQILVNPVDANLLRRLLSKAFPLPPLQAGVEVNTSIGILTCFINECLDLKVEKRIRPTGVFTQRELGLLNNGELSPSFQFSFPKLTSSRSALISSVDRACIMGEQGSDLLRTLIHETSHK